MNKTNLQQNSNLSFEGTIIYIGLDVHSTSWKVTIRLAGRNIKTFSMDTDANTLLKFLKKNYPGAYYKSVYEAGLCGFYIHRQLVELGIENIVINPADIPMSDKDKRSKCDTRDSKKLAEELEKGGLKAIHIPTVEHEEFRSVFRFREQLKKDKRRIMQRIRSHFALHGIFMPKSIWSKKNIEFMKEQSENNKEFVISSLIRELEFLEEQICIASTEVKERIIQLKRKKEQEIIETVPGVGPTTSETLIAELIHPNRFINDNHLCSYVGLIPDTNSSGESEKSRGITCRKKGKLRHIIIEAAWIASKKDPELALVFTKLCSRMKKSQAIIRIAKKLLLRIKRVWLDMKPYQQNINMIQSI